MGKIDEIKEHCTAESLYRQLFPESYQCRGGHSVCRLHEHTTPEDAFITFYGDGTLFCHAAHEKLDVIDVFARAKGLSNREAIRELAEELGINNGHKPKPNKKENPFKSVFAESLAAQPDPSVIDYFERRGVGEVLQGLIGKEVGFEICKGFPCAVFPIRDASGNLFGIQRVWPKAALPDGGDKKCYGKGSVSGGFFTLPGEGETIIAGAIIDGMSVKAAIPEAHVVCTLSESSTKKLASFVGKNPVVFFDRDAAGGDGVRKAAKALQGCRVANWDFATGDAKDANDLLLNGGVDLIRRMIEEAESVDHPEEERNKSVEEEKSERKKQSEVLLEIIAGKYNVFHNKNDQVFVGFQANGHHETWPLNAKRVKNWLRGEFFEQEGKPIGREAMSEAIETLEAVGVFRGQQKEKYLRTAEHEGKLYIDLCNDRWQVVEVSKHGWTVLDESPIPFVRSPGMLPLPTPKPGGDLEGLREIMNIKNDDDWTLAIAWTLQALTPWGPYPILVLQGEQGSSKTTFSKILRSLVDPSTSPVRVFPREIRDLAIAASNSWAVVFDNVSNISPWLSDSFCRLATGGGFSTRTLYTDDEEKIFDSKRPMLLNGIDCGLTRHDLADRSIILTLPAIPEQKRMTERALQKRIDSVRPYVFGRLLDALSEGLRNFDDVKLDSLPRMADFGTWVTACETAIWEPGRFLRAYSGNREKAVESCVDADVVATAIQQLVEEHDGPWVGTMSELLGALESIVPENTRKMKTWPKAANALSKRLKRNVTFLREMGVEVVVGCRSKRASQVTIQKMVYEEVF